MIRRYHVATPEDLKALSREVKTLGAWKLDNVARVWQAGQRKGNTSWDKVFFVDFVTNGCYRGAYLRRVAPDGTVVEVATMKYGPALSYCKAFLRQVSTGDDSQG